LLAFLRLWAVRWTVTLFGGLLQIQSSIVGFGCVTCVSPPPPQLDSSASPRRCPPLLGAAWLFAPFVLLQSPVLTPVVVASSRHSALVSGPSLVCTASPFFNSYSNPLGSGLHYWRLRLLLACSVQSYRLILSSSRLQSPPLFSVGYSSSRLLCSHRPSPIRPRPHALAEPCLLPACQMRISSNAGMHLANFLSIFIISLLTRTKACLRMPKSRLKMNKLIELQDLNHFSLE